MRGFNSADETKTGAVGAPNMWLMASNVLVPQLRARRPCWVIALPHLDAEEHSQPGTLSVVTCGSVLPALLCFQVFFYLKHPIERGGSRQFRTLSPKGARRAILRGRHWSSATDLNPDKLQINPENYAYLRDPVVRSVYDSVLFM